MNTTQQNISYNQEEFDEFCSYRYNHQAFDYGLGSINFGFRQDASDISAHLPLIELIGKMCPNGHATEFGSRGAYSTCALLRSVRHVVSYDIRAYAETEQLKSIVPDWDFRIQDTGADNFKIEPTDFLFIDTLHTYDHVKKELRQAKYVRRFLGFHDTITQGTESHDFPNTEGIARAIKEFMKDNPEWKPLYEVTFNNGLLILVKN
jgi:hypothetical protein